MIGPETERLVDDIDALLDVLLCVATGAPDAARRAGGGGARNLLPAGAADRLPYSGGLLCSLLLEGPATGVGAVDALLCRPELRTLAGRDFCPFIRSVAIAWSSSHACKMRSRSAIARGSSDTSAAWDSTCSTRLCVNARRADICCSGGRDVSVTYVEDSGPKGGAG